MFDLYIGLAKVRDENIVKVIAKIICTYDIISIQEIRDLSERLSDELLDVINMSCEDVFGKRINTRAGSSISKEQIIFLYKIKKLKAIYSLDWASKMTNFERPPFLGLFSSRIVPDFKFIYITAHLKPSSVPQEIEDLEYLYRNVKSKFNGYNMSFVMGDLNADCAYLSDEKKKSLKFRDNNRYSWVLPDGIATNVNSQNSCTYDRIIMDNQFLPFIGSHFVHNDYEMPPCLYQTCLSRSNISDHFPIGMKIYF